MSEQQKPQPLVEYVDTPATAPLEVPCIRWQQAGYDVYSGLCPVCRPGVTLAQVGESIQREGTGHVHVDGPGRILCKCGAHLKLVLKDN